METVLIVIHLLLAIGLVSLVLIQHGKGADMGAAFGSGASATVFGAAGAGNFLSRTTAVLATLFFVTSVALAAIAMQKHKTSDSIMQGATQTQQAAKPAPKAAVPPPTSAQSGSQAPKTPAFGSAAPMAPAAGSSAPKTPMSGAAPKTPVPEAPKTSK